MKSDLSRHSEGRLFKTGKVGLRPYRASLPVAIQSIRPGSELFSWWMKEKGNFFPFWSSPTHVEIFHSFLQHSPQATNHGTCSLPFFFPFFVLFVCRVLFYFFDGSRGSSKESFRPIKVGHRRAQRKDSRASDSETIDIRTSVIPTLVIVSTT